MHEDGINPLDPLPPLKANESKGSRFCGEVVRLTFAIAINIEPMMCTNKNRLAFYFRVSLTSVEAANILERNALSSS